MPASDFLIPVKRYAAASSVFRVLDGGEFAAL
jgi:hypothetical protein